MNIRSGQSYNCPDRLFCVVCFPCGRFPSDVGCDVRGPCAVGEWLMNSFFVQVGVQAIYGRCGFGVCSTDAQDNARLMYRLDAREDVQGATWSVCCIGALVEARLMYRLDARGDVQGATWSVCCIGALAKSRLMYRLDARGDVQGATWSVCCIGLWPIRG